MASISGIKVTGLKELQNKIGLAIKRGLGRGFMLECARLSSELIYKRVKSGYGVTDDKADAPEKTRFKPLSKRYKDFRAGRVEFQTKDGQLVKFRVKNPPRLGEFGTVNKSNLTLTGQMLNSFKTSARNFGFSITIPNTARNDSDLTNAQVASFASEDRPFFQLTDKELKQITNRIQSEVRKQVRNVR